MNRQVKNCLNTTSCLALLCLGTGLLLWAIIGGAVMAASPHPMTWIGFIVRVTIGGGAIGSGLSWGYYTLSQFEEK